MGNNFYRELISAIFALQWSIAIVKPSKIFLHVMHCRSIPAVNFIPDEYVHEVKIHKKITLRKYPTIQYFHPTLAVSA